MPFRYDVFLSHANADKPKVEALALQLRREGVEPWLDKWHLIPGEAWQPGLARGLAESATCAAFVGPGGFGTWQVAEIEAAINRRVTDRSQGFRVIPVLLPGVEKPERAKLPEFLTATTWVEFRDSFDEEEPLRRLVCGIRGVEPDADLGVAPFAGECPYRGLEAFDFNELDPRFFCGRGAQVDDLLKMLRNTLPTDHAGGALRFLAVLGASGSGKSSLARAGMLPALRDGRLEESQRWPIAVTRPGRDPLEALGVALNGLEGAAALGVYDRVAKQADGERSLHVTARLLLGEPPRAANLVILVDQFEEVFTLCDDEARRRALIDNLLHAAKAPDGPAAVVLTMRADFLPRCAPYPSLAQAVTARQYLVEPMTRDQLRRAIERPARLVGLEPEPGLADLLLGDAEKNPGSLPLLQFVLKELWARRRGTKLSIADYHELGGMAKAVANRADAVLAGLESRGLGEITRRIFLSLVRLGEGTEDTRRRARLAELIPAGDEDAVQEVLHVLTDRKARLVTASGDGTIEVAHEALVRSWPKLREWVDSDREGERIKQRLDEGAAEWAQYGRHSGYLDRGPRLALASKWADEHPGVLSALSADFLVASLAHERSELEAAQKRAEEAEAAVKRQKQLGRRLQMAALVAGVLAIASGGLAMWAISARKESRAQGPRTATSRRLAAVSLSERQERFDLSLLLAVEALRAEDTFEAKNALLEAIQHQPELRSMLKVKEGDVSSVAFSPDGETIAAGYGGGGGGVVLFDAATRRRLVEGPLAVKEGGVYSVAFSPDGKTIAAGYGGGGVVLFDAATRRRLVEGPLAVKEGGVYSVAFSPDGKTIAAGYGGGGVVLFDAATRRRLVEGPLAVKEGGVYSVAFSPDGKTIAAGYGGGGVVLFDAAGRRRLAEEPLAVVEGDVRSVAFSPDGKTVAAGQYGVGVVLWDVDLSSWQGLAGTIANRNFTRAGSRSQC